jgi:hypothetical protein
LPAGKALYWTLLSGYNRSAFIISTSTFQADENVVVIGRDTAVDPAMNNTYPRGDLAFCRDAAGPLPNGTLHE